jgi:hypothetical protein
VDADLIGLTTRISRSVQTTIGWIFWDPGAIARYGALGVPGPLGYIASRAAPLAPAGPDAVAAAFGSISPAVIRWTFDEVTDFEAFWRARDEAVVEGLHEHAPAIIEPLAAAAPALWRVVDELPAVGRVLYAAHLRMPRPDDPLLSGWHAVNGLREWRGDTHWALVASAGLSGIEASILHNAWLGYDRDWLPQSRGSGPAEIDAGWASLRQKGLADGAQVTSAGIELRQQIEERTDQLCGRIWTSYGAAETQALAQALEPPCELLLKRVDETAGPNYQPASRIRPPR